MPIKIPTNLPAKKTLQQEGVMVMDDDTAARQDIRPLRIGLLNLMPNKQRTETQFARLCGATPLQVEMTLVKMTNHESKLTSAEHMLNFYQPFEAITDQKFDGFIVTGAPVELLDFTEVTYWPELQKIFDWCDSNVHSAMHICWGAQAALKHYHDVPKHELPAKAFGVFRHRNLNRASPYLRGFSDDFSIPVSRWTETRREDITKHNGLEILMDSEEAGPCLVTEKARRALYMFNHIEYDSTTLAEEYHRDTKAGKPIHIPPNYFPGDDPEQSPENRWRSHAHLLFGNWINEVYQSTPYNIDDIGK